VEHFIAYGVIRPDRFDCLISRGQALCVDEEDAAGFSRNETLSGIVKFLDFLNNVPVTYRNCSTFVYHEKDK
jgi:hypothetical protein